MQPPANQISTPTIFVVFGATGDLARKKLIPALFRLHQKKLLPPLFHVVGFSRQDLSLDSYQKLVRDAIVKIEKTDREEESFARLFTYIQGFFDQKEGYKKIAEILGSQDGEWRTCANKFFYLAVPPDFYKEILVHLDKSKLTEPCSEDEGWTRVVVEKPFGKDMATAEELDRLLGKLFKEDQIYRIDHYLGKETVQNILAFRFSNSFLEPAWNRRSVEKIEIVAHEEIGIEGRGAFYDGIGALRDSGQNHLLQLLALLTMDAPSSFNADAIRSERARVLKSLKIMTPAQIRSRTIRAQYQDYQEERGVEKESQTETYFRIQTELTNSRWRGVPIYLESGKALKEQCVEAKIFFRHETPCLCPPDLGKHYQNVLRYRVQPGEHIAFSFWLKRPGSHMVVEEKDFTFDYRSAYAAKEFVDAYERLLQDVLRGNQTLFVSTAEILAGWRFIDPIATAWKKDKVPLLHYRKGSDAKKIHENFE